MTYTYEMIVEKLRQYPMLQERMKLLRFELSNVACVSDDDVLKSLAYGSPSCETGVRGSSDKNDRIMKMALSYKKIAEELNSEAIAEVLKELDEVRTQIERMDYYMSLLTEEQEQVLRLCFFQKKTWNSIENESGYSRRTLTKRRNEAVMRLAEMYSYMGEVMKK